MTQEVVDTLRTFLDMVRQENDLILSSFDKAQHGGNTIDGAMDTVLEHMPEEADLEKDFA